MTNSDQAWLNALRAPGLGNARVIELTQSLGSIEAVLGADTSTLRRFGLRRETIAALRRPDEKRLEGDLEWLNHPGHHLVIIGTEDYPALLGRIPDPPAVLFVQGDPGVLWQPQLAVVGSRNPTAGGLEHARDFSTELLRQGLTITSGLASGIDVAAHEAALDAGGSTIAVTGTGLDRVYPASSRSTAERIRSQGAIVSEFPLGTPPRRANFPARNRIISGLGLGVLVVEAGLNSGSLITARLAGEQGREVFALPGSLHNPMARGCHRLIKQGARLVESTGDIMEELVPLARQLAMELKRRLEPQDPSDAEVQDGNDPLLEDPDYAKLWAAIAYDPMPVDKLFEQTGFSAQEVSSMLLMLELKGMVENHSGGRVSRIV